MLSRFFDYFANKRASKAVPHQLYGTLVAQSRLPVFYREFKVPDSLNGRFDMLVLHMFVFSHHLSQQDETLRALSQDVFDAFIKDMDRGMRQEGVGDTSIPKRLKKMTRVFYGRVGAYEAPLESGDVSKLAEAIDRNIFADDSHPDEATALASYALKLAQKMQDAPRAELLEGIFSINEPEYVSVEERSA